MLKMLGEKRLAKAAEGGMATHDLTQALSVALAKVRAEHVAAFSSLLTQRARRLLEVAEDGALATRKQASDKRYVSLLPATEFLYPWGSKARGAEPGAADLKDLVKVGERYFLKSDVNGAAILTKAEASVASIHRVFLGKNVQKLTPILKARNLRDGHGEGAFTVHSLSVKSGTLEGVMDFRFQDGDSFSVWNSVVTVWDAAVPFHRFPTTFHNIALAECRLKSEGLAWMVMVFAKGDSEEAYAAARKSGLSESDFLEGFTVEGEGLLPKGEAKAFVAAYRTDRKAAIVALLKMTKGMAKSKAGMVPTAQASGEILRLLGTLGETPRQNQVTAGVRDGFREALDCLISLSAPSSFEEAGDLVAELAADQDNIFKAPFFRNDFWLASGVTLLRLLRGHWIPAVDPGIFLGLVRGVVLTMAKVCRDEQAIKRLLLLCSERHAKHLDARYVNDRDIFTAKELRVIEGKFLPLLQDALLMLVASEERVFEEVMATFRGRSTDAGTKHYGHEYLAKLTPAELARLTAGFVQASLAHIRAAAVKDRAASVVAALITVGLGQPGSTDLGKRLLSRLEDADDAADLPVLFLREAVAKITADATWQLGARHHLD